MVSVTKFCLLLLVKTITSYSTIEYYKNLISENTEKAQAYTLPQSNAEFKLGFESSDIKDYGNYDFIIVGAGSAGSVLATRLSEIATWSILVLEAGDEESEFGQIPGLLLNLQFSDQNWGYLTTPQKKSCLGMKNHQCMAPRGKSIGGTSAINALMYTRGNREDYNNWVRLGNPGWSYEEVLPYFIKSENSLVDGDDGFHGEGGLWNVEYSFPPSELVTNFIEANEELGTKKLDYNGNQQLGVSKTQVSTKNGRRQSSGTAFLNCSRQRTNLEVVTKALVTQIIIDKNSSVAKGVLFVKDNQKFQANANLEVIVSAGAYNSPQLLMLSGIGPKNHLQEVGVDVIVDLPVGQNLMEHPLFPALTFRTNFTEGTLSIDELIEQYLQGIGPLTKPANANGIGYTYDQKGVPMIEFLFIPPNSSSPDIMPKVYNYDTDLTDNYLNKMQPATDIVFYLLLLHPKSRGQIKLKSKNPIDFPDIDLNLFDNDEDIDIFIGGVNYILRLTQTEAFQKINATLLEYPICKRYEEYSKTFWGCILRHMSQTLYHPCGTTAMGPNNTAAVVNHELKVYGIEKLRVIDAGVIPSTMSGHLNAPTIMIAEKMSDVIKSSYI